MSRISEHISYAEGTKSILAVRYGIKNDPTPEQLDKMKVVAAMIFEPLRDKHNKPIGIASFYRCNMLNTLVGGAANSQHMKGEAMDIDADIYDNGITNQQIFEYIRKYLDFDQIIIEFPDKDGKPAWIHVSYVSAVDNRRQVLQSDRISGYTKYKPYR